jgi:IQ calmodulin-binding motif
MARNSHTQLVSGTTRDGVDTRKKENSVVPCEVRRGDNLPVDMITGLGLSAVKLDNTWGDMMTDNILQEMDAIYHEDIDELQTEFNVWRDIADEPHKYGDDDLEMWMELDEKLKVSEKRWRIAGYWGLREQEINQKLEDEQAVWKETFTPIAREAAKKAMKRWVDRDVDNFIRKVKQGNAAIKIQATVRGFLVRKGKQDCCMCLSHRFSPIETSSGYMCVTCAAEEEDDICPRCGQCNSINSTGMCDDCARDQFGVEEEDFLELCCECGAEAELDGRFCSYECKVDFCSGKGEHNRDW